MKIQKIILLIAPLLLGVGLAGLGLTPALADPAKKTDAKPATKKLTGAELYAINCNRCHPERYATEFTTAQWQTIVMHMRVRANLPAAQAKEILKFLKEDAGN
jgi:mono/diheme cytochrome c family protein